MPPGPPPKHPSTLSRQRDARSKGFRTLSAEGRKADAPAWPLLPDVEALATLEHDRDRVANLQSELSEATDGRSRARIRRELEKRELAIALAEIRMDQATDMETALWNELWSSPQAILWEEAHAQREVAQYVRWKVRAEQGDLKSGAEARQLSDRLGLNPLALLRLRAEIERVDEAEDQGRQRRSNAKPAPRKKKPPNDPRANLHAV